MPVMCDEEARVVQMRPVEKADSALSGPVGGSVPYVLGLDAVVLGDGGVSSGAVGSYVAVGDVSVSCGGDIELSVAVCVTLTGCQELVTQMRVVLVVSGAVSGCLCDLDRVSRGDMVVSFDEISLSGGGDAIVLGVDESVCRVNSVLAAGVLALCDVDTVLSGVNSVMSASELDVCGCNSVVSDEAGNSSDVEVVASIDGVVACDDVPLLPDAVRVGGWLSVVGDTLMCGAGVARVPVETLRWSGSTWLGGRANLHRRFLTARATTDACNVYESYVIGCCLLIGT